MSRPERGGVIGLPLLSAAITVALACGTAEPRPSGPPKVHMGETIVGGFTCGPESRVEALHYEIHLDISDDTRRLLGRGSIRFRARAETKTVSFDTRALQVVFSEQEGQSLGQITENGVLCLELPRALEPGAEATIDLVWNLSVVGPAPMAVDDQIWAGYHAPAWMPTVFDPSARATLELRIVAPDTKTVVASGRAVSSSPVEGGRRASTFRVDRPSPPFLFAFAAGNFDEATLDVDGVKLRALGPKGADLAGALKITAPMLRFLVTKTGAPLPSAEYTQVFVNGDAAQEAAGFALIGEQSLEDVRKDPKEDWVFAHELSHQWFGWLVPCKDFADFWLNEGFATFLVAAIKQERWGRAAYDREVELWRKRSQKAHEEGRDAPVSLAPPGQPRKPPKESELQARAITYSRGALVLHKLRTELGDQVFWDGVRRYVQSRADKEATTEDLRAAFEAASKKDLAPFFARWVYAAAPDL
ncbi:MAG: hypothetical protein HOV80_07785 [Polyangiaceae bacterium]|nr:hypothetical protein [Polyangiaceae bacterium]